MRAGTHQRRGHLEGRETARDGGQVDLSAHARQEDAERVNTGSRSAKGSRGPARKEGWGWCVGVLMAVGLLSASGSRVFGANSPSSVELVCSLTQITHSAPGSSGSFSPAINAAGTRIVFQSKDNLEGDNPNGHAELFLA